MLIVVDVGNTNIVICRYEEGSLGAPHRFATDKTKSVVEYYTLLKDTLSGATDMVVSTVVPELGTILKDLALEYFRITPIFVGPTKDGRIEDVEVVADFPEEVGGDLIACAAAVIDEYHCSRSFVLVDMGTATTFTYLQDSIVKGIAITAGLVTQRNALVTNASLLQGFEFQRPKHILGNNTIDCLNAGLVYGHVLMIKGFYAEIAKTYGTTPKLIFTGGTSRHVRNMFEPEEAIFDDDLLMKGLVAIYKKRTSTNRKTRM